MEEKLKLIMANVFGVKVEAIGEDASAHTVPGWDSLKHLDLVLALEKEFGIRFDDEEIPTLINFQIIISTLKAYQEQ
jgi:acyl carrier protein